MASSPAATPLEVDVAAEPGEEGWGDYDGFPPWSLRFAFAWSGARFAFVVDEPYCHRRSEWDALARGDEGARIGLYSGNGEGSIGVAGGNYVFVAAPSGGGGDVRAEFATGAGPVAPLLARAIGCAAAAGWHFKPEERGRG